MLLALAVPPTPQGLLHPPAVWIYNIAIPILGSLVLVAVTVGAIRKRRLTWPFLFVVCSASVFWMETMGDWGQELVYSPRLWHYHVGWLPYSSPNCPYFMPFVYAVYWTVHAWVVLKLASLLSEARGMSLLKAVLILSVPVGVCWDLAVETLSAFFGWWTYDPGFGPVIQFARGRQPLLWPMVLMCIWPNFIAYMAGKPQNHGLNPIERVFGLGRMIRAWPNETPTSTPAPLELEPQVIGRSNADTRTLTCPAAPHARQSQGPRYDVIGSRWRFELARFGAWFLTFQLSFFVILCIPLVSLRLITGHNSLFVP